MAVSVHAQRSGYLAGGPVCNHLFDDFSLSNAAAPEDYYVID